MLKHLLVFFLFILLAFRGLASDDSLIVVKSISISGNKITKNYIIFRELVFKIGDTLSPAILDQKIKKSNENLMNISLFNFVTINPTII